MKSKETVLMEERISKYLEFSRSEGPECINRKINYSVAECSYEQKTLTLCFETEKWMMNPGGVLHGGMMCTVFDITMGVAAHVLSGCFTPTVNLAVTFLSPAPNNDRLLVTARATRVGKTFVQLVAEAKSTEKKQLCATAAATFFCDRNDRPDW